MGLDAARRLEQTISTQLFSSEFIFYTRRERGGRHADHLHFVTNPKLRLSHKKSAVTHYGRFHCLPGISTNTLTPPFVRDSNWPSFILQRHR